MSLLNKVQSGVVKTSYMSVIHGNSGVGKTTFIANIPQVLVLDIESGSKNLDVARLSADDIPDFNTLIQVTTDFLGGKHAFKVLAIDSITTLEHYINKATCIENGNVKELSEIPFGKGTHLAKEKLKDFILLLKKIQNAGYDVWLVGHSLVKKFSDPTLLQQFDRFTIQAAEGFAQEIVRQADNVYFIKHDVELAIDKQTKKAKGIGDGARTMYTRYNAAYDAKTRLNLPSELAFDYAEYCKAVNDHSPKPTVELVKDIESLLAKLKPHDPTLHGIATEKLAAAAGDNTKLQNIKAKLIDATKAF